jgi:hypothetical protein
LSQGQKHNGEIDEFIAKALKDNNELLVFEAKGA